MWNLRNKTIIEGEKKNREGSKHRIRLLTTKNADGDQRGGGEDGGEAMGMECPGCEEHQVMYGLKNH